MDLGQGCCLLMPGVDRELEEGARSHGVPPPPPPLIQQTELNGGEGGSTSMARAEEARAGYGTAGDHWGVAASSLVRAQGAVHAGEVSTVATMTAEMLRHSEVIGYDVFVVPAMLLEAWVAERRNEPGAAEDAYRRALELAGRIGFVDHVCFALVRLGSNALARGDTRQAEELCRRALAMAEAASTSRLAAHARVQLAPVHEAAGDADTAETLYRSAGEWSQTPRPRQVRELLFVVLAGSPGRRRCGAWPG
jgi:hypothetical protein